MPVRLRKFIGAIVLFVFLAIYALVVMAFAANHMQDAGKIMEGVFYVVAGLAWVLPAGLLVTWMQRPDRKAE